MFLWYNLGMEEEKKEEDVSKKSRFGFFSKLFAKNKHKARVISDRSNYHVGWLAPGKTLEDLRAHLHGRWGFGVLSTDTKESDEVLNWRKLTPDEKEQYHIIVYRDGEIRGRIEDTPESHHHTSGKNMREARAEILKYLGDFAIYKKNLTKLQKAKNVYEPQPEKIPGETPNEQK
jgi:hypothetical protein